MKKIFILAVIVTLSFTASALAQTCIQAEVNKTKITTDEVFTYKLTITSLDRRIPQPKLPNFAGFNAVSSSQSSNLSFVKNNIKTVLVYAFILAPTDVGKFKIEPSTLKIKDKAYSTEAFEIEVSPGQAKPKPAPEEKPSPPESEEPQITL